MILSFRPYFVSCFELLRTSSTVHESNCILLYSAKHEKSSWYQKIINMDLGWEGKQGKFVPGLQHAGIPFPDV